jgi:hypothetical protein
MKKPVLLLIVFSVAIIVTSAQQAPTATPATPTPAAPAPTAGSTTNITGVLAKAGQFNTFIRLLRSTAVAQQIDNQLNSSGNGLTIFAPMDNAFTYVAAVRHAQLAVGPGEERAGAVPRAVHAGPHVPVRHREQPAAHAGRQHLAGAVPAQHHRRGPAGQHLHGRRERHRRKLALLRRQPRRLPGQQGAAAARALRVVVRAARSAQEEGEDADVRRGRARRRRRRGVAAAVLALACVW